MFLVVHVGHVTEAVYAVHRNCSAPCKYRLVPVSRYTKFKFFYGFKTFTIHSYLFIEMLMKVLETCTQYSAGWKKFHTLDFSQQQRQNFYLETRPKVWQIIQPIFAWFIPSVTELESSSSVRLLHQVPKGELSIVLLLLSHPCYLHSFIFICGKLSVVIVKHNLYIFKNSPAPMHICGIPWSYFC